MTYSATIRETLQGELSGIREKGLYKEERYILGPQKADIHVEYPAGAPPSEASPSR